MARGNAAVGAVRSCVGMLMLAAAALQGAAAATPEGVRIRHHGAVAYVAGGGTPVQCSRALRLGQGMSLGLFFQYAPDAMALSDVRLTVVDDDGQTVLALDSTGPLVFAQLEPGHYRARASVRGLSLRREVQIEPDGHERVVLTFPASAAPLVARGTVWPCRPRGR